MFLCFATKATRTLIFRHVAPRLKPQPRQSRAQAAGTAPKPLADKHGMGKWTRRCPRITLQPPTGRRRDPAATRATTEITASSSSRL